MGLLTGLSAQTAKIKQFTAFLKLDDLLCISWEIFSVSSISVIVTEQIVLLSTDGWFIFLSETFQDGESMSWLKKR